MPRKKRSARVYAMDCLARREMSRRELIERMQRAEYDHNEIIQVLDDLKNENLQSDERFAEAYIRSRLRRGDGPNKIRFNASAKGVAAQLVEAALNDPDIDWQAVALEALEKHYGRADLGDYAIKAKAYQYLLRKGHDPAMIHNALLLLNK